MSIGHCRLIVQVVLMAFLFHCCKSAEEERTIEFSKHSSSKEKFLNVDTAHEFKPEEGTDFIFIHRDSGCQDN